MSRKQVFYIVFFTMLVLSFIGAMALAVPGFFKNKYPPISTVMGFSFTNQDGQLVTEKVLQNKVAAVNYFFTTCKSICPRMTNNLKPVYDAFKDESDFVLLSHTSDPERDSAAVLKHYADSIQVDTRKWIFLTGRKDSLYNTARYSYKIDDPNNFVGNPESDFLHTQFVALVNKKGEVVHIYDGIRPSEMQEMINDIKKLLKQ